MSPLPWPRLSVAGAVLPLIRRELVAHADAPAAGRGREIGLCAIVEDGLFGYELVPSAPNLPFLIIGCAEDGIPRLRWTLFDPARNSGLRLAALHGRAIRGTRPRLPRRARQGETLYSDWPTAAAYAWKALAAAPIEEGRQWATSMAACRSLENALTIAGLHLAEWDPAIDFFGLPSQAEFGLPLRGQDGEAGTLTLRRPDLWTLQWKTRQRTVAHEWSTYSMPQVTPALLPRDATR